MSNFWWRLARAIAWLVVRAYYGSFRVEGKERIPAEGPVLLVPNHPNSLVDAAAVLLAVPRPVRFAAKGPLFRQPLIGTLLRNLGAVPIERPQDAGSSVRKNLAALDGFVDVIMTGEVGVIFPEGLSHPDPELKPIKSGPARIAVATIGREGGPPLKVVPLGLSYAPAQAFRGDSAVRVGEPFHVDDLHDVHRRQAIRTTQERIADALRPLVYHLERVELAPLVEDVVDIYDEHQKSGKRTAPIVSREAMRHVAASCLNHFLVADPKAIDEVARLVSRYQRLAGRTNVTGSAIAMHDGSRGALLKYVGIALVLLLGLPLYVAGVLTGYVPYRTTSEIAGRLAARGPGTVSLPSLRVGVGAVVFGLFWGMLLWLFRDWAASDVLTATFAGALVGTGIFARWYFHRARRLVERLEALSPYVFRRRAVERVATARAELITVLESLVERYSDSTETGPLAVDGLLSINERRYVRRLPWRRLVAVALIGLLAWFAAGLRGDQLSELAKTPSGWAAAPEDRAMDRVERDARALAGYIETLARLESRMGDLKDAFESDERSFYSPADDAAIRQSMMTYLTCREGLLRLTWYYRNSLDRPPGAARIRGFVVGYTAAVELVTRGMQFIDTFEGSREAVAKLNEADPSWDVPPGVFDTVRSHLADGAIYDELAAAAGRFQSVAAAGKLPTGGPWDAIATNAARGAETTGRLSERLWSYKWTHALARAERTADTGRYEASSVVSTWMGDFRVRDRETGHGLISPEQVEQLRAKLRPGDIMIERRNWYLSNAFLPGYWPHAAIYLGGAAGIDELGLRDDPRVAPHLDRLIERDHEGHERVVIEAISEGVVMTSLEESIGGGDAVCVFRPQLPPDVIADCVANAVRHHGKPYDFDFDFFSTDRLVCTEVVYQAYQEELQFEVPEIMGRKALPALEIVKKWDRERGDPNALLTFVAFLDADEGNGVARESGEEVLVESLGRPGLTLLHKTGGATGAPILLSRTIVALLAMVCASWLLFRVRRRRA